MSPDDTPSTSKTDIWIWDMPCPVVDSVLLMTYEARELINICNQYNDPIDEIDDDDLSLDYRVFLETHRRCHDDCPVSRAIQHQLNIRYARYIESVRSCECMKLHTLSRRFIRDWSMAHAPGFLWALATDPRPQIRCLEHSLQFNIRVRSHRKLASA